MSNGFQLGPLVLPLELLLVLAAASTGWVVGRLVGKRAGVDVENALWATLAVGVLAARLAFVYEYRTLYFTSPLGILDVRDGGWNATAGLVAAWFYGLHRQRKARELRRPLSWALAAGTALLALGTTGLSLQPRVGRKLPELAFTSLEGEPVELSRFTGKPTVVNLWATSCGPCVREMPVLHEAQDRHREVNFVFINQGEERAQVARWLQVQRLSFRNVLLDEKRQVSAAVHQQGYPTTLFFDAKGALVSARLGELSAATLVERLERLTRP